MPPTEKHPLPLLLKSEAPLQEIIPRKIGNCHHTCVSIIKQHWKKRVEIPKEHDFLTWSIQNFVRKVEQFVRNTILFDELTWLKSYTTQENT